MPRVPDRVVEHDFDEEDDFSVFQTGSAHIDLYPREVTQAEKRRWRKEDLERDRRRIKPGFHSPKGELSDPP